MGNNGQRDCRFCIHRIHCVVSNIQHSSSAQHSSIRNTSISHHIYPHWDNRSFSNVFSRFEPEQHHTTRRTNEYRTGNGFSASLFINEYLNAIDMYAFSSFTVTGCRSTACLMHTHCSVIPLHIHSSSSWTEPLKTTMRLTMEWHLAACNHGLNAVRRSAHRKPRFN